MTQTLYPQYQATPVHRLIASKLEQFLLNVEAGLSPRLMITIPPRYGKSELGSVHFPAWVLGEQPDWPLMHVSYNADLSNGFSRRVRDILKTDEYQRLYPGVQLSRDSRSVAYWNLAHPHRGCFTSAGVGGPITGKGGKVVIIDDPVKNRQDADSEVFRKMQREWYGSTLYTRLEGAASGIVLIMCMTGDTPVRMSDGTEKPLSRVCVGDRVATYDNGVLAVAPVLNHASQGYDNIYRITTTSGRTVRANARHPFLVDEGGVLRWIRTKDLTTGHRIVTVRDSGGSGAGASVPSRGAASLSPAGDCASPTTTRKSGLTGTDPRVSTPTTGATSGSSSDTESRPRNTTRSSNARAVCAPSAGSRPERTSERIGAVSSASTTTPRPERSEGCSATTATSPQATSNPPPSPPASPATSDFTTEQVASIEPAGREEVFDVQIDRTENFLAAGLVSHNTRWHTDDLGGYVTQGAGADEKPADADRWEILNIPAICEQPEGDPMGRALGDPIWAEKFDLNYLANVKGTLSERDWLALYQQTPVAAEGNLLHVPRIVSHGGVVPAAMYVLQGWDLAISEKSTADYTVGWTVGIVPGTNDLYLLDLVRRRMGLHDVVAAITEADLKWNPIAVGIEVVGFQTVVLQELRRKNGRIPICEVKVTRDKITRAQTLADRIDAGKVYADKNAPWWRDFESEALAFPQGTHDDQVDGLSVALETFAKMKQWRVA